MSAINPHLEALKQDYVTRDSIVDPVVANDNLFYDRWTIIDNNVVVSPVTRKKLLIQASAAPLRSFAFAEETGLEKQYTDRRDAARAVLALPEKPEECPPCPASAADAAALNDEATLHFNQGKERLALNDAAGALQHTETSLRLCPGWASAVVQRAACLQIVRSYARQELDCAIDENPHNATLRLQRADALMARQDYGAALADVNYTLQLIPETASVMLRRARCLFEVEDFEEAVVETNSVLALTPRDADVWLLQARAYMGRSMFIAATEAAERAVEVNPAHVDAMGFKAFLWAHTPDDDEAVTRAEEALKINPDCLDALAALALVLHSKGENTRLLEIATHAIDRWVATKSPSLWPLLLFRAERLSHIASGYGDATRADLAAVAQTLCPAVAGRSDKKVRDAVATQALKDLEAAKERLPASEAKQESYRCIAKKIQILAMVAQGWMQTAEDNCRSFLGGGPANEEFKPMLDWITSGSAASITRRSRWKKVFAKRLA